MLFPPFPLPLTLHVGESEPIPVGEVTVELVAGPGENDGQVSIRAAHGGALLDQVAAQLEETARRLRAGENLLTPGR